MTGFNKDDMNDNLELSFHYQIIYRVACPTIKFDCANTKLDFELLDSNLEPIEQLVRFPLTNHCNIKWNVFTINLFCVAPLPKIKAVRVSHKDGVPNTGIFLFDVLVNFIGGPEDSCDEETSEYTVRPIRVDESKIRNQRLKIFSYILDQPKVYVKLPKKSDQFDWPPMTYPQANITVLKTLVWLCCTEAIWLANKLLGMIMYLFYNLLLITIHTSRLRISQIRYDSRLSWHRVGHIASPPRRTSHLGLAERMVQS